MRYHLLRVASILVSVLAAAPPLFGAESRGPEWPQFHGPKRDNMPVEKGLLKGWPKDGPALLWKYSECGGGHGQASIADGRVFLTGDFGDVERVLALDLDGKLLWQAENGKSWRGPEPGARTTPTYSDGTVYHLNPMGRLAAFQAESGKEVWAVDLCQRFEATYGTWAYAENLAVEGNLLICTPGGKKGHLVALDKATGALVWANTDIGEAAAYCSPLLVTHKGVRQMITLMEKSAVCVEVPTGKLLWKHGHPTPHNQNVTSPLYHEGTVFVSSGHGAGGRLVQINAAGDGVKELWHSKEIDNCHGGVILLDGHLYGSGCRLFGRGLVCVEFLTGKTVWNAKEMGKVSVTYADGRLYCMSDKGRVSLAEVSPQQCRVVSQFTLPPESKALCLSHPVVCGGRLYIRYWSNLYVYDLHAAAGR